MSSFPYLLLTSLIISSFTLASAQSTNNTISSPDDVSRSSLIPWLWVVKPDTAQPVCPPASATLSTFAAVNGVVAVLNLITGNRVILYHISCGLLGKPKSQSWRYMWLVSLGTQLGANALVAYLYRITPGYHNSASIWQLVLFFTTRPRLGWLVMHFMSEITPGRRKASRYYKYEYIYGYYEGTALCLILAELPLWLMSMYYYGRTAHFATTKGYYIIGHLKGPYAHDAHLMYAGALLALIGGALNIIIVAMQFLGVSRYTRSEPPRGRFVITLVSLMTNGWIGAWLFWVGYVRLAGDLYCPPKLIESGTIWAAFSAFGSIFGGTF